MYPNGHAGLKHLLNKVSEVPSLLYALGILSPPYPPASGGNQCVVPPRLRGG